MRQEITKKVEEYLKTKLMKLAEYQDNIPRMAEYRIEHSFRVAHIAVEIAQAEGFDEEKADFPGEKTPFTLSIGEADNIDRFDAYRLYEGLHLADYMNLEMVRRATNILKEEKYDISWIHYTHIENWYRKLGYETVLKWNSDGIVLEKDIISC